MDEDQNLSTLVTLVPFECTILSPLALLWTKTHMSGLHMIVEVLTPCSAPQPETVTNGHECRAPCDAFSRRVFASGTGPTEPHTWPMPTPIRPQGLERMAERLLQAGANPNLSNLMGQTPLMYAASYGSEELVLLLLRRRADRRKVDGQGRCDDGAWHSTIRSDAILCFSIRIPTQESLVAYVVN